MAKDNEIREWSKTMRQGIGAGHRDNKLEQAKGDIEGK